MEENGEIEPSLSSGKVVVDPGQSIEEVNGGTSSFEVNLELKIVSDSVDNVFGWGVEGERVKVISNTIPESGEKIIVVSSSCKVVSSIEDISVVQWTGENSAERMFVHSERRRVHRREDVDRRLFAAGASCPTLAGGSPTILVVVAPSSRAASSRFGAGNAAAFGS